MEENKTITPVLDEDKSTIEESDATYSETQTKQKKSITIKKLDFPWEVTKGWGDGLLGFQDPETEFWGYCDFAGDVVLEAQYNSINGFNDGYAEVRKPGSNQYYYIDKTGHIVENYTIYETEEKYEYSDAIDTHFENFYDCYCLIFDRTEKYGLYNYGYPEDLDQSSIKNKNFETVVEGGDLLKLFPDLTGLGLTDDYIAVYKVLDIGDSNYDITSSLIDYDMNIIIEPGRYDYFLPLDKDHIIVANYDEQYGLINGKGEVLVELSDKKNLYLLKQGDLHELMHYYQDTTYYGDRTIIILDASYCDYKISKSLKTIKI